MLSRRSLLRKTRQQCVPTGSITSAEVAAVLGVSSGAGTPTAILITINCIIIASMINSIIIAINIIIIIIIRIYITTLPCVSNLFSSEVSYLPECAECSVYLPVPGRHVNDVS